MRKSYILLIILCILIILILIANFSNNISNNNGKTKTTSAKTTQQTQQTQQVKQNTVPNGKVGIVSHSISKYGIIEVVIKNNTGKEIKQVTVTAKCWDKNGNNLGDTSNYQTNVNTKENYKITLLCKTDTNKYELSLKYE